MFVNFDIGGSRSSLVKHNLSYLLSDIRLIFINDILVISLDKSSPTRNILFSVFLSFFYCSLLDQESRGRFSLQLKAFDDLSGSFNELDFSVKFLMSRRPI